MCTRSPGGGPCYVALARLKPLGFHTTARTKRAHFRVQAFKKTPPKFNENERDTKSEILGPPFGAPTLRGRTDCETTAIFLAKIELAKIGLAKFWPKIGFGQDWPGPKHDGQNGLVKNGPSRSTMTNFILASLDEKCLVTTLHAQLLACFFSPAEYSTMGRIVFDLTSLTCQPTTE